MLRVVICTERKGCAKKHEERFARVVVVASSLDTESQIFRIPTIVANNVIGSLFVVEK